MEKRIPLSIKGVCVKCKEISGVTNHHVFPLRNKHKGQTNAHKLLLCDDCHDSIEAVILCSECDGIIDKYHRSKLKKADYLLLHQTWLRG